MKIQCQSCQAKYTIADEKVLGKVVKIRCKKCSATIVINGNETRPAEDNADTHVFDYANQSNEQWTVNVADGDQRTMTAQEIATEYKAGVVNDETYCWKDGMADWLPLREIEQLYGLAKMGPGRSPAVSFDEISVPPQSVPQPAPLFAAGAEAAPSMESSPFAGGGHANGNGSGALFGGGAGAEAVAAAPAAARRGGGRGQGADLFGNVAHAGGEEDVMTSAAAASAASAAAASGATDEKLTGQRNENSVLFSLSALTSSTEEEPKNKTTATSDGSGLIDIRALSANMGAEEKKDKANTGSRVDDIMNLSGGGAFGAALAAPILAPPPLEAVDMGNIGTAESSNKSAKTMMIAIIGAGALIAIAIIVAVVMVTKSSGPQPAASGSLGPSGPVSAGPADTVAAPTTPTTTVADNTPPPPSVGQATGKDTGGAKPAAGGGGTKVATGGGTKPAGDPAPAAAPEPAAPAKPASLGDALAAAAGKPADAPKDTGGGGGATAPFDRGAAAATLGGINVASCKKGDGPTGAGHVKVTFAPNGSVSAAVIDSGPFPGTPVGGCIAGKFRGAHVPPFAGGPVTVGKSFTLN